MILYPFYHLIPNLFDKKQCEQIIEKGEQLFSESANNVATTYGGVTTDVRDSSVIFFDDEELYKQIWTAIHKANFDTGWDVDIIHTERFQFTKYEGKTYDKKNKGQFYGWHQDHSVRKGPYKLFNPQNPTHLRTGVVRDEQGTPQYWEDGSFKITNDYTVWPSWDGKIRKLSLSVVLSPPNNYKGGEFQMDFKDPEQPEIFSLDTQAQGSGILFPSYTHHQVKPVTKGTRYSLVLWILGAPWR